MDEGRNIKLKEMNDDKRDELHGLIPCDKCKFGFSHRVIMKKGLNGKFCPTCYLILETIEEKFIDGELKK